ncbi:MAG: GxxExxY protein [Planctomycetota bacterium]
MIAAAIEVHRILGPRLLEGAYEESLAEELRLLAVERLLPVHHAQLLSYMKQSEKSVGLLLNFNVPSLREGIGRRVL